MMQVAALPLLADNYAWLLWHDRGHAAVIDPSESEPVLEAVRARGLTLTQVLATHHHHDHVGGIPGLVAATPGVEVLCSETDLSRIAGATRGLRDGERVSVVGETFEALHVPGHTTGAIAYFGAGAVFTGDTLFLSGCGRLFEGTPPQMFASLGRLAALPPATLVYCGHEYTEKNLRFALSVDSENRAVKERQAKVAAQRARGEPSVPATLAEELATNPFLRARELAAFTELRRRRDSF
jgi:hydroxyacylglutathione hydrolase